MVEREYKAVSINGVEIFGKIFVSTPVMLDRGGWECLTSTGNVEGCVSRKIQGIDSWHVVQLSMNFIYHNLVTLNKHGWKFYWFGGEEVPLEDLLPPLGIEKV